MGRSWQGRRTKRTNVPTLSAAERRRAEQEAADLAEAEQDAAAAYARGGEVPPYQAGPDDIRVVLSPGLYQVPDAAMRLLGPDVIDQINQ